MKTGICKYCGQQTELIKSHIIPKCFCKIKELGTWGDVNLSKKKIDRAPDQQNGIKEYLLCKECDNLLGKLDDLAYKILCLRAQKLETKTLMNVKCLQLQLNAKEYKDFRKFFISLLWRASLTTKPIPLGKYQNIALQILKNEIDDDEDLFLPLLYKKTTGTASDHFLGIWGTKYLGKHTYIVRFPDYEIRIIVNTKNSNNGNMMKFHKSCFNKNNILIPLVETKTPMDIQLTQNFITCRNNTHFKGLK